ncbi:EpsG family protein [Tianweitania sp. BSSL-BM11]|uniref:EpsG family protein n=1 Tax=Tianweitania aestuarii TaxID=2814886 RepID=A0ABS5RV99_9HYPH|nr:EpsG family protein [Tianweitania aestuarii]MBS9719637.1 EpsG family protein [Tianweitania aestuarii]
MLPYWLLLLVPAWAAFQEAALGKNRFQHYPGLGPFVFLLSVFIGLRYNVGGDWTNYLGYYYRSAEYSLYEAVSSSDPGYILFNWMAAHWGVGIWFVNLACAALFSIGLVAFARAQPRPWLALLVAVPYLVIVVAMGYTRQGVAIGLAMLALRAFTRDKSVVKFVFWIALAATFHKSAVMLVPLAALSSDRGRVWTAAWIAGATALLYYLFLEDSVDRLMYGYITREYQSQGAAIRVAMNALPASIFLVFRRRFQLSPEERRVWTNMALLALAFVVFLFVSPSSTAVDRLALYVIPIQLFVFSRLPEAFPVRGKVSLVVVLVIVYSAAVQFVWLNFAANAKSWVPYSFYPFS